MCMCALALMWLCFVPLVDVHLFWLALRRLLPCLFACHGLAQVAEMRESGLQMADSSAGQVRERFERANREVRERRVLSFAMWFG